MQLEKKENTAFDITIKDNFFSTEDFKKLHDIAENLKFDANSIHYTQAKRHVWFSSPVSEDVEKIINDNVSKCFNIDVVSSMSSFTFVSKSKHVEVHNDDSEKNDFQTIIYIKGNPNIHSGTGFYIEQNGTFILNTHVGFKENRIVSWAPNVYHAPLSFSDEYRPRISIISQHKLRKDKNNAR